MLIRYSAVLALLLSGCGAWQAVSDSTSNAYDTVFHNRGRTVNVDLGANAGLNRDSAGRSNSVAVRVYQLKDRKRFDGASYGDLIVKDAPVLNEDLQASMAVVVNPGGAANLSQPMMKDTKYVAIAAFFQNPDKTGTWKQVIKSESLSADEPLKLALVDKALSITDDTKARRK
ncbi:Type VI secretion lipoprotein [Caballeronia catudaia]|uniref:Type VI secretion lipoprotein n=1 Tax=Caballeronia catudaia TaxID=1777136 RepID=A0A158D0I8_9BURK|nr:type VI secretion system lipoprotein TssJ [Caballeronia catudaia]SAK88164.1 Type VI secretion lipoprotein [Caballeronia catudaia]